MFTLHDSRASQPPSIQTVVHHCSLALLDARSARLSPAVRSGLSEPSSSTADFEGLRSGRLLARLYHSRRSALDSVAQHRDTTALGQMVRRRGGPGPGPVCRSLLAHGQCQQGNCAARHDLPNCTTCNRFFDSVTNLEYHLNGRAHFQVAAQVARPQPPSTSAHRCEGCGALLQAAELVAHTNSPRHLQALRLQRHKAAKIYAEAPKNGVSVLPSGDFDFGHVEHSTRPPGETRKNINAQIVAGDTGFILVRLRLRDAPVGQRLQRRQ